MVIANLIVYLGLSQGWGLAESTQAGSKRLEIVDRAIEYHGGDRFRESRTQLELCSKPGCYQVSAAIQGGLYELRVRGPYRRGVREVLMTNDAIRQWQDELEMEVVPERQAALRDWAMSRVYFCFLPFRLNDDSVIKEDLGLEGWSGRNLHKVKVTFVPGTSTDSDDQFIYWFDPSSGRLEQFAYSFEGNPGGLRFRQLSNFRRVGGLLFFDQENWGTPGDELTVDEISPSFVATMEKISSVELRNIQVDDPTSTID
jgi:hypothetical protein